MREIWLTLSLLALVPVLLAAVVPDAFKLPLIAVGAVLVVVAAVLMRRRERVTR